MITGNGDMASALKEIPFLEKDESKLFFVSGVSNSSCVDFNEFKREAELLLKQNFKTHLIYFSSLCIYYNDNHYARHKKEMENLVRANFPIHTIIRLGNITWGKNPNTLINFFTNKIKNNQPFEIQRTFRYIAGKEEFLHWVKMIPSVTNEMNITGKMMKVSDIVQSIIDQDYLGDPFLLIKYASRGRPHLFKKAIENIQDNIKTNDYCIVVTADEDDKSMNCEEIIKFVSERKNIQIIFGSSKNKIEAINADFDKINFKWDILVTMSDDMKFIIPGWDQVLFEKTKKVWGNSTDFFAHFNDGYCKESICTMSIMGRKYFLRTGTIYDNSYKTSSCDAEATYVAMMLGRYCYFPEIIAKHEHPANNGASEHQLDQTYRMNGAYTDDDTKNYFERLANNFYVPKEINEIIYNKSKNSISFKNNLKS